MHSTAMSRILAFAVLAHHHPIEFARARVPQRALHSLKQPRRPHIRILIETLADAQPQTPQRHIIGNFAIADRAEIDRVEAAQHVEPVIRHHAPVLAKIIRAPRQRFAKQSEVAAARLQAREYLESRRDHFLANAVARNHRNPVLTHSSSARARPTQSPPLPRSSPARSKTAAWFASYASRCARRRRDSCAAASNPCRASRAECANARTRTDPAAAFRSAASPHDRNSPDNRQCASYRRARRRTPTKALRALPRESQPRPHSH